MVKNTDISHVFKKKKKNVKAVFVWWSKMGKKKRFGKRKNRPSLVPKGWHFLTPVAQKVYRPVDFYFSFSEDYPMFEP